MGTKRLNNLCLLSVERDLTLYLQKNVKLEKYRKLLKTKSIIVLFTVLPFGAGGFASNGQEENIYKFGANQTM